MLTVEIFQRVHRHFKSCPTRINLFSTFLSHRTLAQPGQPVRLHCFAVSGIKVSFVQSQQRVSSESGEGMNTELLERQDVSAKFKVEVPRR